MLRDFKNIKAKKTFYISIANLMFNNSICQIGQLN